MINNNGHRMEPSAPPMSSGSYNPNLQAQPQPQLIGGPPQRPPPAGSPQPGAMNIPPMMYSVPGSVQMQPQSMPAQPAAALKPMQQPPPAPSVNEVSLNEERLRVRCPYCYASIMTKVNYKTGTMTHIAALAVLVVCCPLVWVPYVVECCKDVEHTCPNCGRRIGQFKRFT